MGGTKQWTLESLAFDEHPFLDLFFASFVCIKRGSFYTHKGSQKQKLKVDFSSKAKGSNVRGVVRGVGTFSVTCLNLGQLSPYNFKNLYGHLPRNFSRKK
jgi:hypothetical protein